MLTVYFAVVLARRAAALPWGHVVPQASKRSAAPPTSAGTRV